MSEPVTISHSDETGWKVQQGDRWADRLGTDEALGSVASWMFTGKFLYTMKTAAEWEAYNKQFESNYRRK
jgi:hypothetical protein